MSQPSNQIIDPQISMTRVTNEGQTHVIINFDHCCLRITPLWNDCIKLLTIKRCKLMH